MTHSSSSSSSHVAGRALSLLSSVPVPRPVVELHGLGHRGRGQVVLGQQGVPLPLLHHLPDTTTVSYTRQWYAPSAKVMLKVMYAAPSDSVRGDDIYFSKPVSLALFSTINPSLTLPPGCQIPTSSSGGGLAKSCGQGCGACLRRSSSRARRGERHPAAMSGANARLKTSPSNSASKPVTGGAEAG
jgi:hypothetical protein